MKSFKPGDRVCGHGHLGHKYFGKYVERINDTVRIEVEYRTGRKIQGKEPLSKICAFYFKCVNRVKVKGKPREFWLVFDHEQDDVPCSYGNVKEAKGRASQCEGSFIVHMREVLK